MARRMSGDDAVWSLQSGFHVSPRCLLTRMSTEAQSQPNVVERSAEYLVGAKVPSVAALAPRCDWKSDSLLLGDGCRSLSRALASIWRKRSWVTTNRFPTSSNDQSRGGDVARRHYGQRRLSCWNGRPAGRSASGKDRRAVLGDRHVGGRRLSPRVDRHQGW
jgi:hypothetical protein